MKWMLIIAAFGYGGAPMVSVQVFGNEQVCEAARNALSQRQFARLWAREPKYECIKIQDKP